MAQSVAFVLLFLLIELQLSISAPIQGTNRITLVGQHDKQAYIAYGSTVELECQFDQPITRCAWSRQGSLLEITARYSYVRGNGNATADCNINIRNFQAIDEGHWQCESMADSTSGSTKLTSVNLARDVPKPIILSHDEFEEKYNHQGRVRRALKAESFAYACILQQETGATLYWEVNNKRVTDIDSEVVVMESISYTAIILRPKFSTTEKSLVSLGEGDVLKCKARFSDIAIPELSTTFKVKEDSLTSSLEESVTITATNIIIGLGVVIAILLLLLVIFSGILINRHKENIIYALKHGIHRPSPDQRNSTGVDNIVYQPLNDEKPKNVST